MRALLVIGLSVAVYCLGVESTWQSRILAFPNIFLALVDAQVTRSFTELIWPYCLFRFSTEVKVTFYVALERAT